MQTHNKHEIKRNTNGAKRNSIEIANTEIVLIKYGIDESWCICFLKNRKKGTNIKQSCGYGQFLDEIYSQNEYAILFFTCMFAYFTNSFVSFFYSLWLLSKIVCHIWLPKYIHIRTRFSILIRPKSIGRRICNFIILCFVLYLKCIFLPLWLQIHIHICVLYFHSFAVSSIVVE